LALSVRHVGLCGNGNVGYCGLRGLYGLRGLQVVQRLGAAEDVGYLSLAFRIALNNELRTGADKGNPTV
jgi:hypothetical protein